MRSSKSLQDEADRLFKLATALKEAREALLEQARTLSYNAGLQWRTEQRKEAKAAAEDAGA